MSIAGVADLTFRAALEERTGERMPARLGRSETNLGVALLALGERQPDPARLDEAVAFPSASLSARSQARLSAACPPG
jgi:hypothetical protein